LVLGVFALKCVDLLLGYRSVLFSVFQGYASETQPEEKSEADNQHGAAGKQVKEGVHEIDLRTGFLEIARFRHAGSSPEGAG